MMTEAMPRTRHSGWSDQEDKLLWEATDEAQQQGLPLKAVFERIAEMTGRRPNSIRNYYYAQSRQKEDSQGRKARFVPFREEEVEQLLETVLRDKANGCSVRACLNRISGGDRALMLRYQNKYRALIKTKPDLVQQVVERLRAQGVDCTRPQVRERGSLSQACERFSGAARRTGDAELIRACDVLSRHLLGEDEGTKTAGQDTSRADKVRYDLCRMALQDAQRQSEQLCAAARPLIERIKEQLALQGASADPEFLHHLAEAIGPLEEAVSMAGG